MFKTLWKAICNEVREGCKELFTVVEVEPRTPCAVVDIGEYKARHPEARLRWCVDPPPTPEQRAASRKVMEDRAQRDREWKGGPA